MNLIGNINAIPFRRRKSSISPPAPETGFFILKEDGGYILKEDGGKILTEQQQQLK